MPFHVGEVLQINPDFIISFNNKKMPQFSQTEGWLPEFLRDYIIYSLLVIKIEDAMGNNKTIELLCQHDGRIIIFDITPDAKLFSATNGPPILSRVKTMAEEDSNFCSCSGETIYKPLFSSSYPACKDCGKEKRQ